MTIYVPEQKEQEIVNNNQDVRDELMQEGIEIGDFNNDRIFNGMKSFVLKSNQTIQLKGLVQRILKKYCLS